MKLKTLEVWINKFQKMSTDEILQLEYCCATNNKWNPVYIHGFGGNEKRYKCLVCNVLMATDFHLNEHNNGKKHRVNIELKTNQLRHKRNNKGEEKTERNMQIRNDDNKMDTIAEKQKVDPIINNEPTTSQIINVDEIIEKTPQDLISNLLTMDISDMELIEYKNPNESRKSLFMKNDSGYICNLCQSYTLIDLKVMRNHIQTKKHCSNIQEVENLYHPKFPPLKDDIQPTIKPSSSSNIVKNPFSTKANADEEFILNLHEMEIEELLKIEMKYKPTDRWKYLIHNIDNNHYTCAACSCNMTSLIDLKTHLKGHNHKTRMRLSYKIHHPTLLPSKSSKVDSVIKSIAASGSKYDDLEFRNLMNTLSMDDIELVEFYSNKIWKNLVNLDKRIIECNLCKITVSNITSLKDHVNGKKHASCYGQADKFYHPKLTATKTELESIVDNIIDLPANEQILSPISGKKIKITMAKRVPPTPPVVIPSVPSVSQLTDLNSNDTSDVTIILPTIDTITVEDSPEREIIPDIISASIYNYDDDDNDNDQKKKSPDVSESKVENNKNTSIESTDENKIDSNKNLNNIEHEDVVLIDISSNNTKTDNLPTNNKTSKSDNVVLNPLAYVALNAEKSYDRPNYIQNKIIIPNYRSQSNKTPAAPKPIEIVNSHNRNNNNVQPNFSIKTITNSSAIENIEGLIGVEYIVKIIQHDINMPKYECCLCEIQLGGIAMQRHLKNLSHRLKYLDRHFPTCIKQFTAYRHDNKIMQEIVDRIAKAIEQYHGRDLPYECVQNDYRANRQSIMSKVFSFRHASEISGPSFTNIVNKDNVQEIIKNKDKPKSTSSEDNSNCKRKSNTTIDDQCNVNDKQFKSNADKLIPNFAIRNPIQRQQYPFFTESTDPSTQPINVRQPQPRAQRMPSYARNYNPLIASLNTPIVSLNPPIRSLNPPIRSLNPPIASLNQYVKPLGITESASLPNTGALIDDAEHRRLSENFIKNTKLRCSRSPSPRRRLSPRRNKKSRSPRRRNRSRSPLRVTRERNRTQSRSPLRDGDVWQAYRRKFDIEVKMLELEYQDYQKTPQNYPQYTAEWNQFWARRMNELKKENKDHQGHDFTLEWTRFFPKRLEELYENDVEDLKLRLRDRFVLPKHNLALKGKKYHLRGVYPTDDNDHLNPDSDLEILPNSEIKHSIHEETHRYDGRNTSRSKSPRNENDINNYHAENFNTQQQHSANTEKRRRSKSIEQRSGSKDPKDNKNYNRIDNGPLTVVSVLRLLTALEDNLGSLGPRVIDLLSKAISLAKIKPNALEDELLSIENCIFLETCREKLKGQIEADVIAPTKLRAVRQIIGDITKLVDNVNTLRNTKIISTQATIKKTVGRKNQTFTTASSSVSCQQLSKASISGVQKNISTVVRKGTPNSNTRFGTATANTVASKVTPPPPPRPAIMTLLQKKDLAKKLASVLAAQGKTDISTENCEKLIEVYSLIDKKNKEDHNNTNTASDKTCLTDVLTNIFSSGNLLELSTLFQKEKSQSDQDNNNTPSSATQQFVGNDQNFNNFGNMNSNSLNNNNSAFNSSASRDNQFGSSNNFSQLANFDTSLNFNSNIFQPTRNSNEYYSQQNAMFSQQQQQQQFPQILNNQYQFQGPQQQQQQYQQLQHPQIIQQQLQQQLQQVQHSQQLLQQSQQLQRRMTNDNLNQNMNKSKNFNSQTRIDTSSQNMPVFSTSRARNNSNNNNKERNYNNNQKPQNSTFPNVWHQQNQNLDINSLMALNVSRFDESNKNQTIQANTSNSVGFNRNNNNNNNNYNNNAARSTSGGNQQNKSSWLPDYRQRR